MIREARPSDAPELAALCGELGYPSTAQDMTERLPALLAYPQHLVLVAAGEDDRAIAWIHAEARRTLENPPYLQIAGLVVGAAARSGGIGAALVARAEAWGREQGLASVRVHSNVIRDRAHRFYLREGYTLSKTSHLFTKAL